MRLDRLSTLYFFRPLKHLTSLRHEIRIPILMYHSISRDEEKGIRPYYQINTPPGLLEEHMRFLHENDFVVISLSEAVRLLKRLDDFKSNCVVLTFDDGFRDFYTHAFPILQKYGYPATVFLPTGFVDEKRPGIKGKEHLCWKEVRELYGEGITFGSHTVTHPKLKFLSKDAVMEEIRQSRKTIEDRLGAPVVSFSYPYAFPEEDRSFTSFLRETLRKHGYEHGVSTRIGTATTEDDIFFLKRIPVNSCDDLSLFKAKLDGGYDWLSRLQYLSKVMRRNL